MARVTAEIFRNLVIITRCFPAVATDHPRGPSQVGTCVLRSTTVAQFITNVRLVARELMAAEPSGPMTWARHVLPDAVLDRPRTFSRGRNRQRGAPGAAHHP